MDSKPLQRFQKVAISAFVATYVFAIGFWLLEPCPLRTVMLTPFQQPVMLLGLWQCWSVFAPSPRKCNIRLDAEVVYADGSSGFWQYPRIETYSGLANMSAERWRKLGYDQLNWEPNSYLWPEFSRWLARQMSAPKNPVVEVSLRRHWKNINPPPQELHGQTGSIGSYVFYTYKVKPEDLK